jgi:hypothetical protein
MTDTRAQYTAALRQFADWLDANPQYNAPTSQKLLLPLLTNPAVREFADRHGLEVATDAEGNLSAEIAFGPIAYHVYGYVDFAAHVAAKSERDARRWADQNGLDLVTRTDG